MNERLALGTVQFGLEYGIANQAGRVGLREADRILSEAWACGIDTLDTAIAYGESEQTLGNIGVDKWKVVSKLPAVPEGETAVAEWVLGQVRGSLEHLGLERLYAVLLHRPGQLFETQGQKLLAALELLKSSGLAEKIGVSVYRPQELDRLYSLGHFDLVQAPLSILDRRLSESGWAKRLKSMGVELHVRSVFLQGLLLMPASARPTKFARWPSIWHEWERWLREQGLPPLDACLRYVLSVPEVDKIVVGVDHVEQLRQITEAATGGLSTLPQWPQVVDSDLINPARWSQL
jgi:aryl-alcohol dehydrogenase-like predicted oxidoreductase